ncbi:uridine kinase [Bacteroidota bacterium]
MRSLNKIIGITGGSGSGKTYFVNKLKEKISEFSLIVIKQDDYYNDLSQISFEERIKKNFDHPEAFDFNLLKKHLTDLKNHKKIKMPIYDYVNHTRKHEFILLQPKPIIILEGILIFHPKEILNLIDLKIFIDTPDDIRIIRRIRRDIKERERSIDSVLNQYLITVRPMYIKYIEPVKKLADLIIKGDDKNPSIDKVLKKISN